LFDNWKRSNRNDKSVPKSEVDSEEYIVDANVSDSEESLYEHGEFSEGDLVFDQDGPEEDSSEEITEEQSFT